MKNWIHLPLAALVAALVGFGSAFLSAPERAARGADSGPSASELSATLAELQAQQTKLGERLAALPVPASAPSATRTPARDLDEAIAAYMARQLDADDADDGDDVVTAVDTEAAAIADRILAGE